MTTIVISMALVTLHPVWTIKNEDAAADLCSLCIEKTKQEAGCLFYEWFRDGDQLILREGYVDGDAALKHVENVGEELGKLLDGVATLDRFEVLGPKEELEVVKEKFDPLGAKYYAMSAGFDTKQNRK